MERIGVLFNYHAFLNSINMFVNHLYVEGTMLSV